MKRHRSIRRLGLWIVLALLMVVSTLVAIAFLALQSQPLVVQAEQLTPERARQARDLASRIKSDFLTAEQPRDFELSEGELKGLLALAERAIPRIRGRVNVTGSGVLGALTLRVPSNPFGSYLNLSTLVRPSAEGLDLANIQIGSLRLPGFLAEPACRLVLNAALGWGNGTAMLDMIREVRLTEDTVIVTFHPILGFKWRLASAQQRFRQVRDEAAVLGDPELARFYYREILSMAELVDPQRKVPLASYMSSLFHAANRRSASGSAVEENRAAIMALAVYFGSGRFEILTGPMKPVEADGHESRASSTTLADRGDLRLHFIYSAALKLASDSDASFALGEFKEVLDTGPKGSGFSFADLAADRAGVRFAEEATRSEPSARRLQDILADEASESTFFPSLVGLPEDLREQRFTGEYKGLDAPEYRSMLAEIDRRLDSLSLYR
jgi:hypothetical protein